MAKRARTEAGWNSLSPAYRARIERTQGKQSWLNNDKLIAARGHELDNLKSKYKMWKRLPDFEKRSKAEQKNMLRLYEKGMVKSGKFTPENKQGIISYRNELLRIALENEKNPVRGERQIWAAFREDYALQFGKK